MKDATKTLELTETTKLCVFLALPFFTFSLWVMYISRQLSIVLLSPAVSVLATASA